MSKKFQCNCSPEFFKALSDPNRLRLFESLVSEGQQSVGELSQCCGVDLSVISRHLSQLKNAGILSAEKDGKSVLYSVRTQKLAAELRELADCLDQCAGKTGCK